MVEIEYVARVVVERIERTVVPKGTPTGRRSAVTSEDRVQRDKAEVLSFTVRDESQPGIRAMVVGMLTAGLPGDLVKGEPDEDDDEEDEYEERAL